MPPLIALLDVPDSPSSDALCEILSRPPNGWSPGVLIEPMLLWVARIANPWYQETSPTNTPWYPTSPTTSNLAPLREHGKLIDVLAEAAVDWVAAHLVDYTACGTSTRASLAQLLLRLMLALTAMDSGGAALPEWSQDLTDGDDLDTEFAADSSSAGSSIGFWFLLQESLWDVVPVNTYLFSASGSNSRTSTPTRLDSDDPESVRGRGGVGGTPFTPGISRIGSYSFGAAASADSDDATTSGDTNQANTARNAQAQSVYVALVHLLRRKSVWRRTWLTNEGLSGRSDKELKEREVRFGHFRREVGDALVNAYVFSLFFLNVG